MRLLIDDHGYEWQDAWDICTQTFAYTNHTILAEALETWPISTMQTLFHVFIKLLKKFIVVLLVLLKKSVIVIKI